MTVKDSHIYFKVVLDKNAEGAAFGGCPAFIPEEIDFFLNQAQLEVISNKITGNNVRKVQMEGDFSNMSEIDKLICTKRGLRAYHKSTNQFVMKDVHDNGRMTILTFALLFNNSVEANCVLVSHESANLFKQTHNNIPWIDNPVVTLENNTALFMVDPLKIEEPEYAPKQDNQGKKYYSFECTFIKQPTKFDYKQPELELDFSQDVMYEIINRAAVIALENVEAQRTTTKLQINQLSE